MVELRTEKLIIRDHRETDLETHHQLFSDKKAMYYLQDIMTNTWEESKNNLEKAIQEAEKNPRECYFFRIEEAETSVHIGEIGYHVLERTPVGLHVSIEYFLRKEHQGQGHSAEALKAVLKYAFEEGDVYRVSTGCFAENVASEMVMRKAGMIKEGAFKNYTWHDGALKDRVAYGLLKEEWERNQKLS